jgi:hypothetical protein
MRSEDNDIVPRQVTQWRTNFLVCVNLPVWTQTAELTFIASLMNGHTEPSTISARLGAKRPPGESRHHQEVRRAQLGARSQENGSRLSSARSKAPPFPNLMLT